MIKCKKDSILPDPDPGQSPGQGPSQGSGYAPGITPGTPGAGPGAGSGPSSGGSQSDVEQGGGGGGAQPGNEPKLNVTKGMSCAGPNLPEGAEKVMGAIQNGVGAVCAMGCFVKMLILTARQDVEGLNIDLSETFTSLQNMMLALAGSSLTPVTNYALGMLNTIAALLSNTINEIADIVGNFANILKSMVASVVMQSLGALIMAIAQNTVNALKQDLQNRIDVIEDIKTDNGLIRRKMQSVSGLGFWDDLKAAIIASRGSVRSAKRNLASGYSNLGGGQDASPRIEAAERNLWQSVWHLSSDSEKEALLGEGMENTGAWSIEWDALNIYKGGFSQVSIYFSEAWAAIQRISSNYTCLIRIGGRLSIYQTILLAVERLVDFVVDFTDDQWSASEFIGASLSFKIPGVSSMLIGVHDRLAGIETSMNDVVANDQKYIAPVMSETWKTELNALRYVLNSLIGGAPIVDINIGLLDPSKLVISPQASQISVDALNDFNAIMHPEYEGAFCITDADFTQDRVMSLAESFVGLSLSVPNIIFSFDSWKEDSISFDNQISSVQDYDMSILDLIARFSGYEHDSFDTLSYLLEKIGGKDLVASLEKGELAEVLSAGADYLGPISSVLDCLGVVLEGFDIDTSNLPASLGIEIEEKMAVIFGDAQVAQRSGMTMPAIQYNIISDLQEKISSKIAYIGDLIGRLQRGCPE